MTSTISNGNKASWLSAWFSLFTSFGTLICCAIPSLLVAIGMGAALVGIVGQFPQLIWLSENKLWLFSISLLMLLITFFVRRWADRLPCPLEARKNCERTKKMSGYVYWLAVAINFVGILFTYVLPRILYGE